MKSKHYQKEKLRILKSENSENEKGSLLFNNWINYICSSTQKAENKNIKYRSEQIRVRA
jgi:hypothetical protein